MGLRICQVVPHYVPAYHFGGVLNVAHSLSRSLVRLGHDVRVCTTNLKDRKGDVAASRGTPEYVDGVPVYYNPVVLSRYWGFSPALARRASLEIQHSDVVLLHFHYQFASLIGAWLARWHAKPYIIFTHGSLNRFGIGSRSGRYKRLYLNLLERGNFNHALFVAYHSQEELTSSLHFGSPSIVPNGIHPDTFVDLPPKGSFRARYPGLRQRTVYLYLGRLDAGKGLDLLLPAFHDLVARDVDGHLVLAGGDERGYKMHLTRLVSELQIAERVTFTGVISGEDKLAALQDADVYVLPSRSEGLSIAMLEAMYMGLPVIVSDRVGLAHTIEATRSGIVVPLDVASLADALDQMARTESREEMGCRAREVVAANHTWDTISRDLMAKVEGLLQ